jgi:hypothetical protein
MSLNKTYSPWYRLLKVFTAEITIVIVVKLKLKKKKRNVNVIQQDIVFNKSGV